MNRVPVVVRRGSLWGLPQRVLAWVPLRRLVVVRQGVPVDTRMLAHELRHVVQAEAVRGWPLPYVAQWLACGCSYERMPYEVQARAAERDPVYLAWAGDVLAQGVP